MTTLMFVQIIITPTSWKRRAISQTRHCCDCLSIWQLCLSERKKSRSNGVCVSAWTMQFIKQVFPRLISPLSPEKYNQKRVRVFHIFVIYTYVNKRIGNETLDWQNLKCFKRCKVTKVHFYLWWCYRSPFAFWDFFSTAQVLRMMAPTG